MAYIFGGEATRNNFSFFKMYSVAFLIAFNFQHIYVYIYKIAITNRANSEVCLFFVVVVATLQTNGSASIAIALDEYVLFLSCT